MKYSIILTLCIIYSNCQNDIFNTLDRKETLDYENEYYGHFERLSFMSINITRNVVFMNKLPCFIKATYLDCGIANKTMSLGVLSIMHSPLVAIL